MNWMMPYLEAASSRFVASEHMGKLISTALLSMVPLFEGRYAVSTSILMGVPAGFAFLLALVFSTIPMPLILLLLRPVLDWFYTLPIPPVRKFAAWVENRSRRKQEKMQQEKGKGIRAKLRGKVSDGFLDLLGLYIFVAVPLPGTGVWTGSAIATLFEMPRGKAAIVKGYLLRKVGDAYMVMPTGPRMKEYRGMITLNETGAFLFKEAQKPDASRRSLIDAAMAEYKVGEPEAAENVDSFIQQCAECRLFAQINHEIVIYNDPQGESEEAPKE